MFENYPGGYLASVATQRVRGIEPGPIFTDRSIELDPDRLKQAGWNGRHGFSR